MEEPVLATGPCSSPRVRGNKDSCKFGEKGGGSSARLSTGRREAGAGGKIVGLG